VPDIGNKYVCLRCAYISAFKRDDYIVNLSHNRNCRCLDQDLDEGGRGVCRPGHPTVLSHFSDNLTYDFAELFRVQMFWILSIYMFLLVCGYDPFVAERK
jgi:hypothetical protein